MHPFLVDWTIGSGHFRIPTYGVLLALSFTLAYLESLRRAIKLGEDPKHIENLFLGVILSSILGGRLFHVFFEEPAYYWAHPWSVFAVWEGGYTLYGALICSIAVVFVYTRIKKLDRLQFADIAAAPTALGIAVGRLGCFFAGCCWGRPTSVPWAVTFTNPESFTSYKNVPVHPTQLYESAACLLIYLYLVWLFRQRKYVGQQFYHGLACYSVVRFFIEYFRGDSYRGFVIPDVLSYSQLISLVILGLSVWGILRNRKKLLNLA